MIDDFERHDAMSDKTNGSTTNRRKRKATADTKTANAEVKAESVMINVVGSLDPIMF